MSIGANKYFSEGDDGYEAMAKALDAGERIVYDTTKRSFAHVSSDEAKELAKNPTFVTDLTQLKERIESYVQEKGIGEDAKHQLDTAFNKRAEKLAGRFVLFGGKKRDAAVGNLREIPKAINRAAAGRFQSAGNQSQPGMGPKASKKAPIPKRPIKELAAGMAEERAGDDIFGGPPPPPVGGPGGPPPPPPPGMQSGPPKYNAPGPLFKGEQKQPDFHPTVLKGADNKPKSKEVLQAELPKAESFVSSLEKSLVPFKKLLAEHDLTTTQLSENQAALTKKKEMLQEQEEKLSRLQDASKSKTVATTGVLGGKKNPVIPEEQLNAFLDVLEKIPKAQRGPFKEIDIERTRSGQGVHGLGYTIKETNDYIISLKKGIREWEDLVQKLKAEKTTLETQAKALTTSSVSFEEIKVIVQKKEVQLADWKRGITLRTDIIQGKVVKEVVEKPVSTESEEIRAIKEQFPFANLLEEYYTGLHPGVIAQQKTRPDKFVQNSK